VGEDSEGERGSGREGSRKKGGEGEQKEEGTLRGKEGRARGREAIHKACTVFRTLSPGCDFQASVIEMGRYDAVLLQNVMSGRHSAMPVRARDVGATQRISPTRCGVFVSACP
jgi:hypothetical protein